MQKFSLQLIFASNLCFSVCCVSISASKMETVHSTSSTLYKHTVARWTINNFFDHVNRKTKQLNSDVFSLDGLLTQFFLRIHLLARTNNRLEYFLFVDNMAGERSIQIKYKFWLENSNGGKCAETIGKFL